MTFLWGLITGLAVSTIVCVVYFKFIKKSKTDSTAGASPDSSLINQDLVKKQENLAKIKEYIQTKDKVTNDDIQALLDCSDATAERYLDELEKQGILKQVGTEGKYTYYSKV